MNQFFTATWEANDIDNAMADHRGAHPVRFVVGPAISAGGAAVLLADVLQRIATSG